MSSWHKSVSIEGKQTSQKYQEPFEQAAGGEVLGAWNKEYSSEMALG